MNAEFVSEINGQWRNFIRIKYGMESGGWRTKKVKGSFGVGVWKEILKESDHLKLNIRSELEEGDNVRFLENKWCTCVPLSETRQQFERFDRVLQIKRGDGTSSQRWRATLSGEFH